MHRHRKMYLINQSQTVSFALHMYTSLRLPECAEKLIQEILVELVLNVQATGTLCARRQSWVDHKVSCEVDSDSCFNKPLCAGAAQVCDAQRMRQALESAMAGKPCHDAMRLDLADALDLHEPCKAGFCELDEFLWVRIRMHAIDAVVCDWTCMANATSV